MISALRTCLENGFHVAQATRLCRPAARRKERNQRFAVVRTAFSQHGPAHFWAGRRPGRASRPPHPFSKRTLKILGQFTLCIFICLSMAVPTFAQGTLTVQVGGAPSPPTTLVNHGDLWRFHKGTNAPQPGWRTLADASLDLTWASGNGGVGYADNANETSLCQTLLTDMTNRYTTVYLRRSFLITNTADANLHLSLTMDWDDGFVAYLDGVEIQRALAPGAAGVEPAYTNVATGLHESSRGNSAPINPPTTYDLGPVGGRLAPGTHVLAIVGLNQTLGR